MAARFHALATASAPLLIVALCYSGNVEGRDIYVNGVPLDADDIALLDSLNCGNTVPDGKYWVNWDSGSWGYEGGPQEGIIECSSNNPGVSEDMPQGNEGGSSPYWEDRMCETGACDGIIVNPVYQ